MIALFVRGDEPKYTQVLKNARDNHQQIVIVFSGSDWCANCIRYKTDVLDNAQFRTYQNSTFLIYTADFPRKKNALSKEVIKTNEALAEKYNPTGQFPFTVLIDENENLIKSKKGNFKTFEEFKLWFE